ncbi:Hpt domain-containing protein [Hyphomonas adhaerens]|uniref:Hpt domain-containing protein n=1 Tax=Hyphomonas adhaerens TaxID=81029 RepID=UPI002354CD4A|nr:Hpt domain-containing protein [Hyphomonas adhaerens]
MFKNLLTVLPTRRKSSNTNTAEVTIDIGRVIKPAAPVQTRQAAEIPIEMHEPDTMGQDRVGTEILGSLAEDAVDSLSGQFEAWMRGDLDALVRAWSVARGADATAEDYRAVFTAAHNIKGAANSYGYPAIARLCGSLSRLLTETRPGENAALINLHVEACRAAFNSIGQGSDGLSIADAVCEALEERVELKVANA